MTPELHQRVRRLFDEALGRPEADRLPFLEAECAEDTEVFRQVVRLLRAHDEARFFLQDDTKSKKQFGRYIITEELGRGATGVVYAADDPVIHRRVAIKVVHFDSLVGGTDAALLRERLFREARLAGLLSHPGIATIFDVGECDGRAYIAMERVWGASLQDVLSSGSQVGRAEALDMLRQTAVALDYAHEKHVVHRDVKPANILLQEGRTVKVVDFGIAKIMSTEKQSRTSFGIGTPSYMSPEQIEAGVVDGRSDQFSLAVIAFELLTGTRPFKADSPASLLHSIVYGDRPSAQAQNRALPSRVDRVFFRALQKRSENRYGSCAEFVAALASALGDAATTVPGHAARKGRLGLKRYLTGVGSIVAASLLGILLYKQPGIFREQPRIRPPVDKSASDKKSSFSTSGGAAPRPQELYAKAVAELNARRFSAALALFREAANAGDASSMIELGEIYAAGVIVNRNDVEAIRWYRRAADAGDARGMLYLGGMYSLGTGVPQDYRVAARWFQAAADAGNPSAMFNLGWLYEKGQGIPKDLKRADELYRKAADLGNDQAKRRLARWPRE
jgi:serine/threonine protein kinase